MAADPTFKTSKIFVGGLPQTLNTEALTQFFSQYGDVVDCVIVTDKETRQSRCFGFVQFSTCSAVDHVMKNYYNIIIDGKWVECKKALPKDTCSEILKSQVKYQVPEGLTMGDEKIEGLHTLPMPADLYQAPEEKENLAAGLNGSRGYNQGYYNVGQAYGNLGGYNVHKAHSNLQGMDMGGYMDGIPMPKMEAGLYKQEYTGDSENIQQQQFNNGPDVWNRNGQAPAPGIFNPSLITMENLPLHMVKGNRIGIDKPLKIEPKIESNKLDFQPF